MILVRHGETIKGISRGYVCICGFDFCPALVMDKSCCLAGPETTRLSTLFVMTIKEMTKETNFSATRYQTDRAVGVLVFPHLYKIQQKGCDQIWTLMECDSSNAQHTGRTGNAQKRGARAVSNWHQLTLLLYSSLATETSKWHWVCWQVLTLFCMLSTLVFVFP